MLTVRWNATHSMIASILDNNAAVDGTLLRTGHRELQIAGIEKALLQEVKDFLQPFLSFTNMVSGSLVHVGYITLIRHEIQTLCQTVPRESSSMWELKCLILANLDRRLPESKFTRLATLLDPGTKDAISLSREEKLANKCPQLFI